jgi:hypothetical protein
VSFASTCGDSCVGHYRTRSDRHRIANWARRPRRVLIQFEKYSRVRARHHHVEAGRPRGHRHQRLWSIRLVGPRFPGSRRPGAMPYLRGRRSV